LSIRIVDAPVVQLFEDDVLQRELSSISDEKMKTIIATIQKEQNQIIRNDKNNVLPELGEEPIQMPI